MKFRYGIEDRPPLFESLLMGLQWCAVALPLMIVFGKIAAGVQGLDSAGEIMYLQKIAFIMAIFLLLEILLGHRLPLIMGPSSVILVGIVSSAGYSASSVYTAILFGGLVLAIVSATGCFVYLRRLFTRRVVSVVLLLIAFTLTPSIISLTTQAGSGPGPGENLSFAIFVSLVMFVLHRYLTRVWKSILILLSMVWATAAYLLLFPQTGATTEMMRQLAPFSFFFQNMTTTFSFDAGLLIAFFVGFVALSINDLGSIESMSAVVEASEKAKRVNRGIMFTGLANAVSGLFGVIGQVNYSFSVGVVVASGCASRFALIPTVLIFLGLSLSPALLGTISNIPSVVVGSILLYVLATQAATGFMSAFNESQQFTLEDGLVIGTPLLMAVMATYVPAQVLQSFPPSVHPIISNGFVVGVTATLLLEHGIFRKRSQTAHQDKKESAIRR